MGFLSGKPSFWHTGLTAKGWERVYELETKGNPFSNKIFIAMWFDKSMTEAWENGIRTAIKDVFPGFAPIRIDYEEHNNEIVDEIIANIRESRFVIADFTGQRNGVYYEAGFAVGLNKPIIMACRVADFKNCSFDTNHRNHIVWKDPEDLRIKLINRIRATIL